MVNQVYFIFSTFRSRFAIKKQSDILKKQGLRKMDDCLAQAIWWIKRKQEQHCCEG
ncbi:MAG: hypothetical protein IJY13_05180 [Clostridia bacterium]|nr:hypothetical protein [Clostridia bacterium]